MANTVAMIAECDDDDIDGVIEQLHDHLSSAFLARRIWQWQYERMLGFLATARNYVEKEQTAPAWKRCVRVVRFLAA